MTVEENKVMEHLVDAWNSFIELPKQHPDDVDEFRHALHLLEYLLMVRQVRDRYPHVYTNETNDGDRI